MRKVKWELDKEGKSIAFDEEGHTYFDKDKEYVSVTNLIKKYVPVFDESGIIVEKCAAKKGCTVEEMKEEWDNISQEAIRKGTETHFLAEFISLGIPIPNRVENSVLKACLKPFFEGKQILSTEQIIFDREFGIAGTVDLMCWDGYILLYDYKTNNKPIGEGEKIYGRLLEPLNYLDDSMFNKYALQMSMYQYLLERKGYKVGGRVLVHIKKDGYLEIPLPYLKQEVEEILK